MRATGNASISRIGMVDDRPRNSLDGCHHRGDDDRSDEAGRRRPTRLAETQRTDGDEYAGAPPDRGQDGLGDRQASGRPEGMDGGQAGHPGQQDECGAHGMLACYRRRVWACRVQYEGGPWLPQSKAPSMRAMPNRTLSHRLADHG